MCERIWLAAHSAPVIAIETALSTTVTSSRMAETAPPRRSIHQRRPVSIRTGNLIKFAGTIGRRRWCWPLRNAQLQVLPTRSARLPWEIQAISPKTRLPKFNKAKDSNSPFIAINLYFVRRPYPASALQEGNPYKASLERPADNFHRRCRPPYTQPLCRRRSQIGEGAAGPKVNRRGKARAPGYKRYAFPGCGAGWWSQP